MILILHFELHMAACTGYGGGHGSAFLHNLRGKAMVEWMVGIERVLFNDAISFFRVVLPIQV